MVKTILSQCVWGFERCLLSEIFFLLCITIKEISFVLFCFGWFGLAWLEAGLHYTSQAGFELVILLPYPPDS